MTDPRQRACGHRDTAVSPLVQAQPSLPETACGAASPGHFRSQVVPLSQLRLHGVEVQVTWQVDPSVHDALPLVPSDTVQLDALQVKLPLPDAVSEQLLFSAHSALHELPHEPVQVLRSRQASEQEFPLASHPVPVLPTHVQVEPALQVQALPLQEHSPLGQSDLAESPQAARAAIATVVMRAE